MRTSIAAAVVGALVLVVGLMLHADRAAASFVAFYVATASAVLGVLLMIMIAHLSGAVWFVPFRQAAATVTATLPWLALLAIPLVLALPAHGLSFTLRALVYWAAWLVVGELLRNSRTSRQRAPRRSGGLLHEQRTARLTVLSAAGIPAATLALTFAAFDWAMSLSPEWSSTVYGPYVCAGGMVAGLGVLAAAGTIASDASIPAGREHYQSLGQLLLACVLLWGYLWYSQFFIIWIASVPREVAWYVVRFASPWRWFTGTLVVTGFLIPFLVLLFRAARGSRALMIGLGTWLVVAHYADVYWLVIPSMREGWVPGDLLWDPGAALFVIGSTTAAALWRRRTLSAAAVADDAYDAALGYEAP